MNLKYDKPITKEVIITPEMAQELLDSSLGNRTISEHTVNSYARDLANNTYHFNGETLTVDSNGNLRNGHHRCKAVIKAGIPMRTNVSFGINPADCYIFDVGRGRSCRDNLKIKGQDEVYCDNRSIAVARMWFNMVEGINKPSNDEINLFIEKCYTPCRWLREHFRRNGVDAWTGKTSIRFAILCALVCGVNPQRLIDFGDALDNGVGRDMPGGRSVARLEKDLRKNFQKINNTTRGKAENCTEHAIYDYINGVDRTQTYWKPDNPFNYYSRSNTVKELLG